MYSAKPPPTYDPRTPPQAADREAPLSSHHRKAAADCNVNITAEPAGQQKPDCKEAEQGQTTQGQAEQGQGINMPAADAAASRGPSDSPQVPFITYPMAALQL